MKFIYLGMQRCGTKSFSNFFKRNGYRVFSWSEIKSHSISEKYHKGLWIDILNSGIFQDYDVFEDGPFYRPEFARFLANYVPNAKFIYFHRPPEDWYKSMITHSSGMTLGNLQRHAYFYDRLEELAFIKNSDPNLKNLTSLPMIGQKEHYTRIYKRHQLQIYELFEGLGPDRFFSAPLYDTDKYQKMCIKFELKVKDSADEKSHSTKISFSDALKSNKSLFNRK